MALVAILRKKRHDLPVKRGLHPAERARTIGWPDALTSRSRQYSGTHASGFSRQSRFRRLAHTMPGNTFQTRQPAGPDYPHRVLARSADVLQKTPTNDNDVADMTRPIPCRGLSHIETHGLRIWCHNMRDKSAHSPPTSPSAATLAAQTAAYLAALFVAYMALWTVWPNQRSVEAARDVLGVVDIDRQIIFLGDSSLFAHSDEDLVYGNTIEILNSLLPEPVVGQGTVLGLGPPHARDMLVRILHPESRVRAVILCVNLGFLTPAWYMRPQPFFGQLRYFLRFPGPVAQAFFRPLIAFRAIELDQFTPEQHRTTPIVYEGKSVAWAADVYPLLLYPDTTPGGLRMTAIARFMQPCTRSHPSLIALRDIARECRNAGIHLIAYITPVNYQRGEAVLGPAFRSQVHANAQLVTEALSSEGARVVDLTFALDDEYFEPKDPLSVHIMGPGRRIVAERLRDELAHASNLIEPHAIAPLPDPAK